MLNEEALIGVMAVIAIVAAIFVAGVYSFTQLLH